MWLVSSRHPPAPMAWAGFCSGCPRSNAHPVTRRPGTPHTNFFACASASSPVTAWSCRSNRPSRALRADPPKRHPPDRFRLRPTSSRMRLVRTDKASLDRAPLLRFRPLQHTLAATRCPGQPASGRSRFDVDVNRARACAEPSLDVSSLRFSAWQSRRDDARWWWTPARGAFQSNPSPVPTPRSTRHGNG
jgi:hypothetical protein